MNKHNAKYYLPLVQALADGKEIELLDDNGIWHRVPDLFTHRELMRYRIKPTPALRQWKPEEAIGKSVRSKESGRLRVVTDAGSDWACFVDVKVAYDELLLEWEQLDGKPCGVEEA